jgi:hypothetical protein
MVLERDEIEPGALGEMRERDDVLGALVQRRYERAEDELVSVVGHCGLSPYAAEVGETNAHTSAADRAKSGVIGAVSFGAESGL